MSQVFARHVSSLIFKDEFSSGFEISDFLRLDLLQYLPLRPLLFRHGPHHVQPGVNVGKLLRIDVDVFERPKDLKMVEKFRYKMFNFKTSSN